MLESFKIVALIGTLLFLFSAFLPLASNSLFDFAGSFSLLNIYSALGQSVSTSGGGGSLSAADIGVLIGVLMLIVLFPVALILGLVSIVKRRIALPAGILGILCWIGGLIVLNQFSILSYAGLGVYLGLVGAIILAAAYFMKPSATIQQPAVPAPPPPQQ